MAVSLTDHTPIILFLLHAKSEFQVLRRALGPVFVEVGPQAPLLQAVLYYCLEDFNSSPSLL